MKPDDTQLHNSLLRSGHRWRPSPRTIARLRKLAARLGLPVPETYRRYYPGHHQRSAGAWLWAAQNRSGFDVFASCYPVQECLSCNLVEVYRPNADYLPGVPELIPHPKPKEPQP